jgi:hypothetical protein
MEELQILIFMPVSFFCMWMITEGLSVIGQIVFGVIKSIFSKKEKNDYSYIDFEEDLY